MSQVQALPTTARGSYGFGSHDWTQRAPGVPEEIKKLLEVFYNTILSQGHNVCITNLSHIQEYYVNLHIYYKKANGRSVQIETMDIIDHQDKKAFSIIGQTLWDIIQEADRDNTFLSELA